MSRFLKNLFGDKSKGEGGNASNRAFARDSFTAHPGGMDVSEERLTEELNGRSLKDLWKQYQHLIATDHTADAAKVFEDLTSLLNQIYYSRDARLMSVDSAHAMVPNISGHPLKLLDCFLHNITQQLQTDSSDIHAVTELFRLDTISLESLFAESELRLERRRELCNSLEAFSILMCWPQNVANIRHNHGLSYSTYILDILVQFSQKLKSFQDLSCESDAFFVVSVLLYIIKTVSSSMMWSPYEFGDYLPIQPWTSGETHHALESFSSEAVGPSKPIVCKNSLLPTVTANSMFNPLRTEWRSDWLGLELISKLSVVWCASQQWKDQFSADDASPSKNLIYILQAELLFLVGSLLVQFPDIVTSQSASFEWLNLRDVFESYLQLPLSNDVHKDALFLRLHLLVIRINATIVNRLGPSENLLLPTQIASLLVRYQTQYQDVRHAHDWVNLSSLQTLLCFHYSTRVGHVDLHHDLWPWQFDVPQSAHAISSVSSDFHLIQKDVAPMIAESVRRQPCYMLWDAVVCELLGSQALSTARVSVNQGGKVNKARMQTVFYIFHLVFQDKLYLDPSFNPDQCLTLPLGQLKFVDFISQLFKAAESEDIFAVLDEFDVLRMLLGERFLSAQSLSLSTFSDVFEAIVKSDLPNGQTRLFVHELRPHFMGIIGWILLQNSVLDYFHGLVIYSIYFQSSAENSRFYLSHEEIMLMLVRKVVAQANSLQSMHIVYQLSKLLIALTDIVLSMTVAGFNIQFKLEIIFQLFEAAETIVRYRAFNSNTNQISSEQDLYVMQSSCNAVGELLIHLLIIGGGDMRDWLDIFLIDDQYRSIDLTSEFQKGGSVRHRSMSTSVKITSPESVRGDDKNGKLRSSVAALLTMLIDEKLHLASLQIAHSILLTCAKETHTIDQYSDISENLKQRKQTLRSLAAEVIGAIIMFIAVCHKHSNVKISASLAISSLSSLTMLLRDERYISLRLTIQEFIRRENLLYEMLRAFARSLNGFDLLKQKLDSVTALEVDYLSSQIMRAGLATLTATVSSNDACKNMLSLLLQANREKVGGGRGKPPSAAESGKLSTAMKTASGLSSLILCGERSPSRETIVVLMDLVLDGPRAGMYCLAEGLNSSLFCNDDDRPKISNAAILPDFFQLIPHCEESVQLFALDSFKNLVSGRASLINQNVCSTSRPKVLDIALDLFPFLPDRAQSSNAELVELLGRHSVSVASLKHLFRTLQQREGLKHPYSWKIVQALQGMFLHESGPKHTFVFDGSNSGLRLPTVYKWPSTKGFSFCCWIRIESPRQRQSTNARHSPTFIEEDVYNPFILCLRDNGGAGLELYLKKMDGNSFRIVARYYSENGDTSTFFVDAEGFKVHEEKWYFLGMSISPNSFYNKGEILIALDSQYTRHEFSFTRLPEQVVPMVGECLPALKLSNHQHALRGQMGAMYFFCDAISEAQLRGIASLGPDYVYNFESSSADFKEISNKDVDRPAGSQRTQNSSRWSILEDGVLTSKIMLTFNPVVLRGKYFLDNTPEKNDIKWRVPNGVEIVDEIMSDSPKFCKMHALRLAGTYRSTIQVARLALNSLGGIKAIIPLFAQLDQTLISQSIDSSLSQLSPVSLTDNHHEANFFPAVLGLFTTLLEESAENRRNFHRIGGFNTIRFLLDRADSMNFNLITFNQFVALYLKVEKDVVLQDGILDHILCNFKLWAHCSPEVQFFLIDWLVFTFRTDKHIYPQALSLQRLIDSFYLYYDYSPANILAFHVSESTSVDSSRLKLSKLDHDSIESIRWKMFGLMKVSLKQRVLPDDIAAIVKYLTVASTERAKKEILMFLIDVVMDRELKDRLLQILLGYLWGSSIELLESVFVAGSLDVKLLVLYLFGLVLHQMKSHWASLAALYIQFASESNPASGSPMPTATPTAAVPSGSHHHTSSADDNMFEEIKKLGKTLEGDNVTSPSNFMHGSGLMQHSCKLLHSAVTFFMIESHDADHSIVLSLFMDMLMGAYPETFIAMVRSRLRITESKLPSPTRLHRSTGGKTPIFAFPFVFFVVFNGLSFESVAKPLRESTLRTLASLLTPFTAEQLLAVSGWQDIVASSLDRLLRLDSDCCSETSDVLKILSELISYSVRVGKMTDFHYVLSPDLVTIPSDVQFEIYNRILRGDRFVGMTSIRDFVHAIEANVESFAVKAFILYFVVTISMASTREQFRQFHDFPSKVYDSSGFLFVQKRNTWLIGLILIEYFEMMDSEIIDCSSLTASVVGQSVTSWLATFSLFSDENKSLWRIPLMGTLVKDYLQFSVVLSTPEHIPSADLAFLSAENGGDRSNTKYSSEFATIGLEQRFAIGSTSWIAVLLLYKLIGLSIKAQFAVSTVAPILQVIPEILRRYASNNPNLSVFEQLHFCAFVSLAVTANSKLRNESCWESLYGVMSGWISEHIEIFSSLANATKTDSVQRDDDETEDSVEILSKILEHNMSSSQCSNFSRHSSMTNYSNADNGTSGVDVLDRVFGVPTSNSILFSVDTLLDVNLLGSKNVSTLSRAWKKLSVFLILFREFTEQELIPTRMMEYGLGDFVFSNERQYFVTAAVTKPTIPSGSGSMLVNATGSSSGKKGKNALDPVQFTVEIETVRIQEYWRHAELNNRRSEIKWSRTFAQLANERGPWGYGADSKREVYWMLDNLETDRHIKLRMKRNPFGTRHMIASLKSAGIDSADEQAAALSTIEDSSLSGIYADLKKYKKRMIMEQGAGGANTTGFDIGPDSAAAEKDLSDNEEDAQEDQNVQDSTADSENLTVPVEIITPASNPSGGKTLGRLELGRLKLSFFRQMENRDYDFTNKTGNAEFMWACECFPSTSWLSQEIVGVYRRLYQMRYVAIEIFYTNRTSVFFNCFDKHSAKKTYRFLMKKAKCPNLNNLFDGKPSEGIGKALAFNGMPITQAWELRKISNFEYLMYLNFIAGRSFNDLAQYPVFPWVIADYKSSKIDLKDPSVYRKFDRPMAAQMDSQQELLREKYESCEQLQDDGIFPYHTGSHFSSSAMVIWYLLRMEPFTSYHVWLQDGKFDRPDRLFHSIEHTYAGCTTNTQDVKELIPEFFYNPEFLFNSNSCEFGKRQSGHYIDDVTLPRWCRDATEFIRINRDALESEYVSSQLHLWIDLIFGSHQRPPFLSGGSRRAVDSLNVFVHLSYVDAVDLDAMKSKDPMLYNRTIRQIDSYGQTPVQLFTKDHPRRKSLLEIQDLIWPIASVVLGADTLPSLASTVEKKEELVLEKPTRVLCYGEFKVSNSPILCICELPGVEKLVTIDSGRVVGYHSFIPRQPDNVPPFSLKTDRVALQQSSGHLNKSTGISISSILPLQTAQKEKTVGIPFAAAVVLSGSITDRANELDMDAIGTKENRVKYLKEEANSRNGVRSNANVSRNESQRLKKESSSRGMNKQLSSTSISPRSLQMEDSTLSMSMSNADMLKSISGVNRDRNESFYVQGSPEGSGKSPMSTLTESSEKLSGTTPNKPTPRSDEHLSPHLFCVMPANKLLISCGHWDNTFKITSADNGKLVQSLSYHREVVTCVTTTSDYGKHWIAAGSKDCTVTVWEIFPERESEPVNASPSHTLYGHDDAVNCIAMNNELDVVVSGSDDGTIIVHTLREGLYVRSISFGIPTQIVPIVPTARQLNLPTDDNPSLSQRDGSSPATQASGVTSTPSTTSLNQEKVRRVNAVLVSKEGYIVGYSNDGYVMVSYTLNGRYLRLAYVREKLYAMCLSDDGRVVLTGGERGLVVLRWIHNLTIADTGPRRGLEAVLDGSNDAQFPPFSSPIRSLTLTTNERHLIVGLESGEIRILAQDSEYLRRKLHRRLMEIGILSM